MSHDESHLRVRIEQAIARVVTRLQSRSHPQEIAGFALATDDDLETLLGYAVTSRELEGGADSELLFQSTDWPHELADSDLHTVAMEALRACTSEDSHSPETRAKRFSILVGALASLKQRGIFPRWVYLTVLSTDPGEQLERLEDQAVVTLNEKNLVEGWQSFLRKWR